MNLRNIPLGHLLLKSMQAATLRTRDSNTSSIVWSQCNLDLGNEKLHTLQKDYDCAKFSVPLDYTNENSSEPVVLDLVKANATKQPSKGSVFYNPGGPGGSGVSVVIGKGGRFVEILGGHYDIISFDPRSPPKGPFAKSLTPTSGSAGPLSTLLPRKIMGRGADTVAYGDWERIKGDSWRDAGELTDAFYEGYADTGRFYGTPFVARDIVKISDALGQGNQINYWGTSYGTVLGQVLAAMFPSRIGRMLLDGNVLSDEYFTGTLKSSTKDAEKAILRFFDECLAAGPQVCSLAANYSTKESLLEAYNEIQRSYRLDGTLSITGRSSSKADRFESLVFLHLYTPSLYPLLDERIKGALEGNETAAFLPLDGDEDLTGHFAFLMITCGDTSFRADTPDDLFSVYKANLGLGPFGDMIVSDRFRCARWKFQAAEQVDANSFRRIKTKHPVLIVNESRVVVHEGVGHSFIVHPSNCTEDIVARYFNSGSLPEVNTTCKPNFPAFGYASHAAKRSSLRGWHRLWLAVMLISYMWWD
ncbi:unnamed protein product [Fusarium venenatum]|uniref:AB hydrolase-1 domain-containing protein n=1 Tax=Fusarium venenatum TaxID=56646 RepID=A0A2L2TPM0_9HYPO|nr:LOW QUALITY PROTEIN: uncharacterized protein FVRRES_07096 [Fusarium venenatum]CEI62660.1 unnamed protein product [Fusarium venenatum]